VERALARALEGWGPARRVVLFGDEPCIDRLLAELTSDDLFGEPRAIVVRRADKLMGEERLARAVAAGVPSNLALAFLGESLSGPVVRAADDALFLPTPTGRALRALASELLAEADLPRSAAVVEILVEASGGDTLRLSQEVAKLAIWQRTTVPARELDDLVFAAQRPPYAYLDAVGARDTPTALAELRRLLTAGGNPSGLFFTLVAHLRSLLAAAGATAAGRTPPGPSWLVRRRLDQARRWGEARLVRGLASLQQLDVQIKTGQISPEAALHLFTLDLAQGARG